jgi:hypothetical protein
MKISCFILLCISIVSATSYQLQYCSETRGSLFYTNDYFSGFIFTPPCNSLYITYIWLYSSAYVHYYVAPADLHIRLYRVESGIPTTELASRTFTPPDYPPQWRQYSFMEQWDGGTDTEFCIAVQPRDLAGSSTARFAAIMMMRSIIRRVPGICKTMYGAH